ncbi:hypothetical protein DPMN_034537 [Dreissena polymorpha]|uniref:Uncharacterized protein n=1 Tax=Dreissena polymorpha TaxID=45954 RepID=A0A9D4M7Q0_DREPO|nr:hypothetical protein DPMN_034537 [Dreissena polymorpha]
MSLSKWLKTGTVQTRSPTMADFPDPAKALSTTEALLTQAANDAVEEMVIGRKRKREEYASYRNETRAKIARYAIDNWVAKASRHFTANMGKKVSETTVRSMRDQYVKRKRKKELGEDMKSLSKSSRKRHVTDCRSMGVI